MRTTGSNNIRKQGQKNNYTFKQLYRKTIPKSLIISRHGTYRFCAVDERARERAREGGEREGPGGEGERHITGYVD